MLTLPVQGMTCAACAARIEAALRAVPGVGAVQVSAAEDVARVDGTASLGALDAAVAGAGYALGWQTQRWGVVGVSDAAGALALERALAAVPGVASAQVDPVAASATVRHLASAWVAAAVAQAARSEGVGLQAPGAAPAPLPWWRTGMAGIALGLAATTAMMLPMLLPALPHPPAWAQALLASWALFGLGARHWHGAWVALRHASANMDTLIVLGAGAAWGLSLALWAPWAASAQAPHAALGHAAPPQLYFESVVAIVTFARLGKWLEAHAKRRTLAAVDALAALRPARATRVQASAAGEAQVEVDAASLAVGDVLLLRPGERLAADGVVVAGESQLDEALLTGESVPLPRRVGDIVLGGAINGEGVLRVRATAVGVDTQVALIAQAIGSAQSAKAPVQQWVDRIAAVFAPAVVLLALATGAAWWLSGTAWDSAVLHAVAVLVIACPCALGLATPAALTVGSGVAARHGLLVRDTHALVRLHEARTLALDKTGTLTLGQPRLVALAAADGDEAGLLARAAALQRLSEHPLARAVLRAAAERGIAAALAEDARAVAGSGMQGRVGGSPLRLGHAGWMAASRIAINPAQRTAADAWQRQGASVSWLGRPGGPAQGWLAFADSVHPHAGAAMQALAARGVHLAMLSGDNADAAAQVARALGIAQVHAPLTPAAKTDWVRQAASDARRAPVAMVGDGVNDGPALAAADVGVAMVHARGGTDLAVAAAGLTVLRGDPWGLVQAWALSAATQAKIRQNLFWAFAYNVVAIPAAALGALTPGVAAAAMAASSVCVVVNALRLARWQAPALPTQAPP